MLIRRPVRVDVAPGEAGLVWTRNAGTPSASAATYAPYADGWFRTAAAGMPQIAFRTVQGRRLMLTREIFAPELVTSISRERVPGSPVPAAWLSRLGRYRALNRRPIDALVVRSVRLTDVDGALVLALGSGLDPFEIAAGRQVLEPASRSLAFTFGLGPGIVPAEGKGDSVKRSAPPVAAADSPASACTTCAPDPDRRPDEERRLADGRTLDEPYDDLRARVRDAPALNMDETRWRLKGDQQGIW